MGRVGKRLLSSFINVGNVMFEALCARPPFGSTPPGPGAWSFLPVGSSSYLGRAVSFGTDVFVFGGRLPTSPSNQIRKFNTLTNSWTLVATLPWVGESSVAVVIGNLIYVHGGAGTGTTRFGNIVSFNPVTNVVTPLLAGLPARAASAVSFDGKMYVFGGETSEYINTLRFYDPVTNAWSVIQTVGSIPEVRAFHDAVILGTKMYVVSGVTNGGQPTKTLNICDLVNWAWEPPVTIDFGVYAYGIGLMGKRIYVCGGVETGTVYSDATRIYDTETEQWTLAKAMPKKVAYVQAAVIGDKLFSTGGYAVPGNSPVTDTLLYTPS